MTTATVNPTHAAKRNLPHLYLIETKYEFLKLWRLRAYSLSTLVFPVMFYLIIGGSFGSFRTQGIHVSAYLVACFAAVGVINAAVFAFGASVAAERGQGWTMLKRVSPMPSSAAFTAKTLMAMMFSALVLVALTATAFLLQGVRLPVLTWLQLLGTLVAGVIPFAAMGLAFGYALGPNSAPTVLNLVTMPMTFASGLYMPITQLPPFVQHIAPYLPAYHFGQLALAAIGAHPIGTVGHHVLVLAGFTAVLLAAATLAYRRDEGRTYG
ncbi:MAG: ABC transporter permease [Deinococcales bacterium]|jgi:ABC-2 type transport system permease protein